MQGLDTIAFCYDFSVEHGLISGQAFLTMMHLLLDDITLEMSIGIGTNGDTSTMILEPTRKFYIKWPQYIHGPPATAVKSCYCYCRNYDQEAK